MPGMKLEVPSRFTLPDLSLPGLTAMGSAHRYLEAVYYDTDDLRLARWGCRLGHRTGEGWTVELPSAERCDLVDRGRVVLAGRWDAMPAAARELVRAFSRRAPLRQVARLRTVTKPVVLVDAAGRRVAEVVDDRVAASHRPGPAECFREVGVEMVDGTDPSLLDALIDRLHEAGAGSPITVAHLTRALGPSARRDPDVVVGELDEDPSGADVIRAAFAQSVRRFILCMSGVLLDEDPEFLHQARVGTRRLRSDLRTFGELIDPGWAEPLRVHLRWLGSALGQVRDADVLAARIRETAQRLPDPEVTKPLVAALEVERNGARAELLRALRTERYGWLLDQMVEAAARPVLYATASEAAGRALAGLAKGPLTRLLETVEGLPEPPGDADLHQVRIRAKRVRYAAEAVTPVFGKRAAKLARRAARLQDTLGELQDASVAYARLERMAATDPSLAFAAGQLAGFELVRAEQARAGWRPVWDRLLRTARTSWT